MSQKRHAPREVQGSRSRERHKVRIVAGFDPAMFAVLRDYAVERGISVSQAIRLMVGRGLETLWLDHSVPQRNADASVTLLTAADRLEQDHANPILIQDLRRLAAPPQRGGS